jgi:SAM-dependent methyltransferase
MALPAAYRRTLNLVYGDDPFSRLDEEDDAVFYSRDRLVEHLDRAALEVVERIIGALVVEPRPDILDLMAGPSSHLPAGLTPGRVVGLGLNERELAANTGLTERLLHDLNADPVLPLADGSFDIVLNVVSVDYMTRPFEVFREVGRVLRPGGLLLVIISDRMFPQKAVKVWRQASEPERVLIVEDYFAAAESFGATRTVVVKGRPRPADDRHAAVRAESDPIIAVYAERLGDRGGRPVRPEVRLDALAAALPDVAASDLRRAAQSRVCPYCCGRLRRWNVPQTPFTELDTEVLYVCFNDACPYLQRGWAAMARQGNVGVSYRAALHPRHGGFLPLPVHSLRDLKAGIDD